MSSFNLTSPKNIFLNIWGLVILLILILLFQLIGYFGSVHLLSGIFQVSTEEIKMQMLHPDGSAMGINIGRWSNFIQFICYMGIPAILFVIINKASLNDFGGYSQKVQFKHVLWSGLIGASALPVIQVLTKFIKQLPWPLGLQKLANKMEYSRSHIFENLLDMQSYGELLICILILAFLPAVLEEFLFRGIVLKIGLTQFKSSRKAIFFQGFIFAVMHFTFYEFSGIFLMGVIFGYISLKFNNLWYNSTTHFVFNGLTVTIHFFILQNFQKTGIMIDIESILNNFFVAVPASIIFGYSIYQLKQLKPNE